jgi:glutamate carboxypeptidase
MTVTTEALRAALNERLDELTTDVVALAEINSGSRNPDGVNRCGERLAELVDRLSPESIESIEVQPSPELGADGRTVTHQVGRALRAVKRPEAPFRVCLFGHLDTVFGPDDPFQDVTVTDRRLAGPGVADCKGGLVLAIEVLRYLDTVEWGDEVGWEFLVVPDEEIGSLSSKDLLRQAAEVADIGLGFEPALPSGGVAAARKGSLTGHLVVRGRAAHAGRAHADGRSAILGLSSMIVELEGHNTRPGLTVNCGKISGGGPLNVVPDFALASFNMRVEAAEDQQWIEERFNHAAARAAEQFGVTADVVWSSARPPKIRTPELDLMLDDVTGAATDLGLTVRPENTGGCCDGNDLAAAGLVNVDSLGIAGGGIHSPDEFAHVDSIPPRAAMVAEVLRRARLRSIEP